MSAPPSQPRYQVVCDGRSARRIARRFRPEQVHLPVSREGLDAFFTFVTWFGFLSVLGVIAIRSIMP